MPLGRMINILQDYAEKFIATDIIQVSTMMKMNKIILVSPLVAVLAVSMVVAAVATPAYASGHLDIESAEVQEKDGDVKLELYTAADVTSGLPGFYGYAALTSDFQDVLVAVTHLPIDDVDPDADEETGFHTHIVDLTTETECASGIAVAFASPEAVGELKVDGTEVKVTDVDAGDVGDLSGDVASFTLTIEDSELCVNVSEIIAATD